MVILELIHELKPDFAEGLCLLVTEPTLGLPGPVVIHDKRTERIGMSRRWTVRDSDLSAFDGRVLAYRGIDG